MPNNGHDISSRGIFSSLQSLPLSSPDTSGALGGAAVAPGSGSFIYPRPGASSDVVDQRFPPAADVAFQRPLRGVGQDKGASDDAPTGSSAPSPVKKVMRRGLIKRQTRQKAVRLTLWVQPGVKLALQTIAASNRLSLSATGATGLEEWVRQDIQRQQQALLQPMLRKIIREELRTFSNRLDFFLMRIAFAAEQGRILITNVLSRLLTREGVPETTLNTLLDQSHKMARRNILRKTPQMQSLLEEWEGLEKDDGNCSGGSTLTRVAAGGPSFFAGRLPTTLL